ncbi:MAG: glycosyltransferase family 2 protein [Clostridia bacterium]|nr:glycosyltransferase family 2 protein [Clostridia bacterium]
MLELFFSIIGLFTALLFSYQTVYLLVGLFHKPKLFTEAKDNRFAVLISARNEEVVIEYLLNSLRNQTYPSELYDVYVVADNCTDRTADIARQAGAIVLERFDTTHVGKGYALDFLLSHIKDTKGDTYYDGYFVFDADNILEPDFIEQMNLTFSAGYKIITSYRNSKNYDTNWISSGYALWFLREARYVNNARMILNTSCAVSGTGFLFHRDMLKKRNGWKYFLLTEDIEFSVFNVIDGEKIGYCHKAMLYDEQPETFSVSWKQRLRWARGFLQVFRRYGWGLFRGIFKNKGNRFSCLDLFVTTLPFIFVTILALLGYTVGVIWSLATQSPHLLWDVLVGVEAVGISYLTFFLMGLPTIITEWRSINSTPKRKILSLFTFSLYMFTWVFVGITALFKKVEWTPIRHNVVKKSVDDVKKQS